MFSELLSERDEGRGVFSVSGGCREQGFILSSFFPLIVAAADCST